MSVVTKIYRVNVLSKFIFKSLGDFIEYFATRKAISVVKRRRNPIIIHGFAPKIKKRRE